jgi:GT2 family glycosyltransferase
MPEPRFSVVTPVYRPPYRALKAMLHSVSRQTFGDWEHCLVDDESSDPEVRVILEEAAVADPRVRVRFRDRQGGIVAASNDALEMGSGEFVAFLDHDDELRPDALEKVAAAIEQHGDADYLYSDEDKIDGRDLHFDPFVKPGWSPDRLSAQTFVTHFRVIRRSAVVRAGGFREGFDGAQDWDLALRIAEQSNRFIYVPGVLYHWRASVDSAAYVTGAKPWAHRASHRAVSGHVRRMKVQASAEPIAEYPGLYWLRPALKEQPPVSIVIPTGGQTQEIDGRIEPLVLRCVRSIVERSTYENYELLVVADEHVGEGTKSELQRLGGSRLTLVDFDREFNFSAKVNLGARKSGGQQILLLNDDTEIPPRDWRPLAKGAPERLPVWNMVDPDGRRAWIESMLVYAMRPGVGAVGAKLYFPNGRLQHGGVICRDGRPAHPYYLGPGDVPGYQRNLLVACNFLAVTAACVMTPRAAFDAVGAFDEALPLNYNDVDYCLRLREAGLRTVFLPHVELLHRESISRGIDAPAASEIEWLRSRWGQLLYDDPFYGAVFSDNSFMLPLYTRHGEFRDRSDPRALIDRILSIFDRTRRALEAGGPRLVLERLLKRIAREIDRRRPRPPHALRRSPK